MCSGVGLLQSISVISSEDVNSSVAREGDTERLRDESKPAALPKHQYTLMLYSLTSQSLRIIIRSVHNR